MLNDLMCAFEAPGKRADAVVHLAGLKAASHSIHFPSDYWDVNVSESLMLLRAMRFYGCQKLLFSSSTAIYGVTAIAPIPETEV